MRLYHFSEDPSIETFVPRPVAAPAARRAGEEWLNGPLVWAIDEWHQPMYFFPRDCPRILVWPLARTTAEDLERWWNGVESRMIAHVEEHWYERMCQLTLFRYELPPASFVSLDDAGMYVSRETVRPLAVVALHDLPRALSEADVELRIVPTLRPLRGIWETTLHASGIRLRNAADWDG